jgi:hypothetical protein
MKLKLLRLTLHSDAPMHGDATKLRGFFATSFNEHALLHQHVTDKLIYKYPLIQYKMLQGSPLVLGINEGAEVLKDIYDKFDEIKLGESKYSIMERGVTLKGVTVTNRQTSYGQFIYTKLTISSLWLAP